MNLTDCTFLIFYKYCNNIENSQDLDNRVAKKSDIMTTLHLILFYFREDCFDFTDGLFVGVLYVLLPAAVSYCRAFLLFCHL